MGRPCCTRGGEEECTYRKGLLEIPRRRWVDNIKMDLRDTGWGGVDWIGQAQDRDWWWTLVNMVLNLRVP
jgi:hypothetical protein